MDSRDPSRIERLKQGLYSRNQPAKHAEPLSSFAHSAVQDVKADWGTKKIEFHDDEKPHISNGVVRFFGFSLFFFLVAVGVALFIYYRGTNVISSENIEIDIKGPVSIGGGEQLDLDFIVRNLNNTSLEMADLKVKYPEGARNPDDVTEAQKRTIEQLGIMAAGETKATRAKVILYGEEESKQTISATLAYRIKGSNATFEKEQLFEVQLSSSPVRVTVNSLKEINTNQDLEFSVEVASNSDKKLSNLLLKAEYGFGFIFASATPAPLPGNVAWNIGDLKPGEKRTYKIKGKLQAQDGEERVFHFAVGVKGVEDDTSLEPQFVSTSQKIAVKKPFIGVDLALDGNSAPVYPVYAGRQVRADLAWVNNLDAQVSNVRISAKLNGTLIDRSSINVDRGFYRSQDDTIVWDRSTLDTFSTVSPGTNGRVSFTFSTLTPSIGSLGTTKNPEISIDVSVGGRRTDASGVPEDVLSSVSRKMRLITDLDLKPRIVYSTGPFQNKGPIPPKVDRETTYTVILSVTNTVNDVRDARVTAILPSYVKWLGVVNPSTEEVTVSASGGELSWDIGSVSSGQGFASAPRQVAFQISFVPSLSQVEKVPVLLKDIVIEGTDRFTGTPIRIVKSDQTTRIGTDPAYKNHDEVVTK